MNEPKNKSKGSAFNHEPVGKALSKDSKVIKNKDGTIKLVNSKPKKK